MINWEAIGAVADNSDYPQPAPAIFCIQEYSSSFFGGRRQGGPRPGRAMTNSQRHFLDGRSKRSHEPQGRT